MRFCRSALKAALCPLIIGFPTVAAHAHGFGQRYDLPLPLSFFISGAGATVALSFLVFALFLRQERAPRYQLDWKVRPRVATVVGLLGKTLAVTLLVLAIVAGLFGNQDPIRNTAPVTVWVIGWVGLAFLSMLVGGVWRVINPWNAVFRAFCRLARREFSPVWPYPARLEVWPAFVLLLVFAWLEIVWAGRSVPNQLAMIVLVYSCMTWAGMLSFGRKQWLEHGELFSLLFGMISRFAPIALLPCSSALRLRVPGTGLIEHRPLPVSFMAVVIGMLATVTFDGFLETPLWSRVDLRVLDWAAESPTAFAINLREDQAVQLVRTAALLICVLLFAGAYALVCWAMLLFSGSPIGAKAVASRFVLTLVPIAIAYHIAHYFSYLLITGQYAIPLLSDPFGKGWNLFGTANYRIDIAVVAPRMQWIVALVAVVLGHVIAVYLSHVAALRLFGNRRSALISQIPMLVLMIAYTMLSLWILSQPIIELPRA